MGQTVTLMLAGKPLTFNRADPGDTRVEGCLPPHVPVPKKGPCPKHRPGGAKTIKDAIKRAGVAVPKNLKGGEHEKAAQAAQRARVAKQLMIRMAAGEKFETDVDHIPDLYEQMQDAPPMNLSLMQVKGKPKLFQHHLRDIPRDQMPALPDTVEGLAPLMAELDRRGVKFELIDIHPDEIQATQSQLSAPKVAKLAGYMKQGWKEGGAMIISQPGENALGDGHHRWAGSAMAAMLHQQGYPGFEKPVIPKALRVHLPIDDLLKVMEEYSGPKKSLTEAP